MLFLKFCLALGLKEETIYHSMFNFVLNIKKMACQHQVALFQATLLKQTFFGLVMQFSSSRRLCDRPKECLRRRPVPGSQVLSIWYREVISSGLPFFHFLFCSNSLNNFVGCNPQSANLCYHVIPMIIPLFFLTSSAGLMCS